MTVRVAGTFSVAWPGTFVWSTTAPLRTPPRRSVESNFTLKLKLWFGGTTAWLGVTLSQSGVRLIWMARLLWTYAALLTICRKLVGVVVWRFCMPTVALVSPPVIVRYWMTILPLG